MLFGAGNFEAPGAARTILSSLLSFQYGLHYQSRRDRGKKGAGGTGGAGSESWSELDMVIDREDEKTVLVTMWREMEVISKKQEITQTKQTNTRIQQEAQQIELNVTKVEQEGTRVEQEDTRTK